jgi:hypothetical protein
VGEVECCTRDLTDVVVRNDDAGKITFDLHFDGRPEGTTTTTSSFCSTPTGMPPRAQSGDWGLGIDYMIGAHVWRGHADAITLYRWAGRGFHEYFVRRIHVSTGTGRIRITLDRHLIGDTDGFRFNAQVWEVAQGNAYSDLAPDRGWWSFPLTIATRRLRPSLQVPSRPRAGRRFTTRLALRVGGTRQLLGSGRVLCSASIAGARLRAAFEGFAGRRAVCRWQIPPGSRGKTIRGSVAVAVTSRARISRRFATLLG